MSVGRGLVQQILTMHLCILPASKLIVHILTLLSWLQIQLNGRQAPNLLSDPMERSMSFGNEQYLVNHSGEI